MGVGAGSKNQVVVRLGGAASAGKLQGRSACRAATVRTRAGLLSPTSLCSTPGRHSPLCVAPAGHVILAPIAHLHIPLLPIQLAAQKLVCPEQLPPAMG